MQQRTQGEIRKKLSHLKQTFWCSSLVLMKDAYVPKCEATLFDHKKTLIPEKINPTGELNMINDTE